MTQIILPWPHKDLSPNARKHHLAIARHKATAKAEAAALTRQAIGRDWTRPERVVIDLRFCPPTAARRDLDNMLAAMKAALDGVSLALGIDDSEWGLSLRRCDPVKGGSVVVTVLADPQK